MVSSAKTSSRLPGTRFKEAELAASPGLHTHQLPTAWNSSCRYILDETRLGISLEREYTSCGDKESVYALEGESLLVPSSSDEEGGIEIEADSKGVEPGAGQQRPISIH